MQVVENKTIDTDNGYLEECTCCGSKILLKDEDYSEAREYGVQTFMCPCCNMISDSAYSSILKIQNIQYPQHFYTRKQSQCSKEDVQKHIKQLSNNIKADEWYNYIEWEGNIVLALREEDDIVRLIVCSNYSDTICTT